MGFTIALQQIVITTWERKMFEKGILRRVTDIDFFNTLMSDVQNEMMFLYLDHPLFYLVVSFKYLQLEMPTNL